MGFVGFVSWFAGGLIIVSSVQIFFHSAFLTGFVAACIIGVLGAKE